MDKFSKLPKRADRPKPPNPALPEIGRSETTKVAAENEPERLPPVSLAQRTAPALPEQGKPPWASGHQPQSAQLPPVRLGQQPSPFPTDRPAPALGLDLPTPPDAGAASLASLREAMGGDLETEQERISQQKAIYHRNRFAFNNVLGSSGLDHPED
jgi:hypothetical protein